MFLLGINIRISIDTTVARIDVESVALIEFGALPDKQPYYHQITSFQGIMER